MLNQVAHSEILELQNGRGHYLSYNMSSLLIGGAPLMILKDYLRCPEWLFNAALLISHLAASFC